MRRLSQRSAVALVIVAVVAVLAVVAGLLLTMAHKTAPVISGPSVTLGDDTAFAIEVVSEPGATMEGLSGRERLDSGHGMSFQYGQSVNTGVWMPDMHFPLDIAWISQGRVTGIITLQPCPTPSTHQNCPASAAPGPIDGMLEVPAGELKDVEVGDTVMLNGVPTPTAPSAVGSH